MIAALILPVGTRRYDDGDVEDVVDAPLLELLRAAVEASLQAGEYPVTDAVLWLCRVDHRWRRRFGLALLERAERLVLCLPGNPGGVEVYGSSFQENLTEEQHSVATTWVTVLRKAPTSILVRHHHSTPTQNGAARFVTEADVQRGQDLYSAVRAVVRGYVPTDALANHVGLDMGHMNGVARVQEQQALIVSLQGRIQELQAQIPGTAQYKQRQLQRPPPSIAEARTLAIDPEWAKPPPEHWAKTRAKTRRRK